MSRSSRAVCGEPGARRQPLTGWGRHRNAPAPEIGQISRCLLAKAPRQPSYSSYSRDQTIFTPLGILDVCIKRSTYAEAAFGGSALVSSTTLDVWAVTALPIRMAEVVYWR